MINVRPWCAPSMHTSPSTVVASRDVRYGAAMQSDELSWSSPLANS